MSLNPDLGYFPQQKEKSPNNIDPVELPRLQMKKDGNNPSVDAVTFVAFHFRVMLCICLRLLSSFFYITYANSYFSNLSYKKKRETDPSFL